MNAGGDISEKHSITDMNEKERIRHFAHALDNLVEHLGGELDLTHESIIGALQVKIQLLVDDSFDDGDDDVDIFVLQ